MLREYGFFLQWLKYLFGMEQIRTNKVLCRRIDYVLCKALLILLPFNVNQHITSFKHDPHLTFGIMYDGKSIYICWPLAATKNALLLQAWTFR